MKKLGEFLAKAHADTLTETAQSAAPQKWTPRRTTHRPHLSRGHWAHA